MRNEKAAHAAPAPQDRDAASSFLLPRSSPPNGLSAEVADRDLPEVERSQTRLDRFAVPHDYHRELRGIDVPLGDPLHIGHRHLLDALDVRVVVVQRKPIDDYRDELIGDVTRGFEFAGQLKLEIALRPLELRLRNGFANATELLHELDERRIALRTDHRGSRGERARRTAHREAGASAVGISVRLAQV